MKLQWILGAALFGTWTMGSEAAAATKLPPCMIVLEEPVPEEAHFVVTNERANELQSDGLTLDDGRPADMRIQAIGDGYSSVTIRAKAGDRYPFVHGSSCHKDRMIVADTGALPFGKTPKMTLGIDEWHDLTLDWGNRSRDGETRVDWAYTEAELDAGQVRTELIPRWKQRYRSRRPLRVADGALKEDLIYLRITRYRVDGTKRVWKGWAYKKANGRLAVGHKRLPKAVAKRFSTETRCPTPKVVEVPTDPLLYRYDVSYLGDPEFGLTETQERRALQVDRRSHNLVQVTAPEGTLFRVDDLPRHPCPTWLRATAKARPVLQIARELSLSTFGGPAEDYEFELDTPDGIEWRHWPLFESKWSPTLTGLDHAKGKIQEPHNLSFTNMKWGSSVHIPEGLLEYYVEVTPLWKNEKARVPVRGKIRIEINEQRRVAHFEPIE